MKVSPDGNRRRRYARQPLARPVTLTPLKRALVENVARLELVSLPQLALLVERSQQATRRQMRQLYDAGLVEIVPVPRFALAEVTAVAPEALLHGSAPNIYQLTRAGQRLLHELREDDLPPLRGRYGPQNSLFVAHELQVRDAHVFFARCARRCCDHRLERWNHGGSAEIDLQRTRLPKVVRPDAVAIYRMGARVLVALLEVDRGTERGTRRWQEKLQAYELLFRSGRLREHTGYAKARVLVTVPNARRRDRLAGLIQQHAPPELACRFWLAEHAVLERPDLTQAVWRVPGSAIQQPLVPQHLLESAAPEATPSGGFTE